MNWTVIETAEGQVHIVDKGRVIAECVNAEVATPMSVAPELYMELAKAYPVLVDAEGVDHEWLGRVFDLLKLVRGEQ